MLSCLFVFVFPQTGTAVAYQKRVGVCSFLRATVTMAHLVWETDGAVPVSRTTTARTLSQRSLQQDAVRLPPCRVDSASIAPFPVSVDTVLI